MRRAVTALFACLVGVHCGLPADDGTGRGADLPGEPGRDEAADTAPPIVPHRGNVPDGIAEVVREDMVGELGDALASSGAHVSSFVKAPDGTSYAAGTYEGTLVVGETFLHSRGDTDVFLLRAEPNGTVAWAVSVGSEGRERAPRVSLDAADDTRVRLLGTSDGEMNCGGGPMATWAGTSTFFVCVFEGFTGVSIAGGAFPVAP